MEKNFAMLHDNGAVILHRSYGDQGILDVSLISSFSSSLATFRTYLNKRDKEQGSTEISTGVATFRHDCNVIQIGKSVFAFKISGDYTFILHAPLTSGISSLIRQLHDVESLLVLIFGASNKWTKDSLLLDGMEDVFDSIFLHHNVNQLVDGISSLGVNPVVREQIDLILQSLEIENDSVYGSILLLGCTLVHSRLSPLETNKITKLLSARSMNDFRVNTFPVFSEGSWKNLIKTKINSFTLCVLTVIQESCTVALSKLSKIERKLHQVSEWMSLPTEDIDLNLGCYTGMGNSDSIIVNPALHPAPDSVKEEIQSVFLLFIQQVQDIFDSASQRTNQIHLYREPYRFYASISDTDDIYILCSSRLQPNEVENEVLSIVSKIRQQFHGIKIFNKAQTTKLH